MSRLALAGALLRALPEWLVVGLPGDAGIALRHAVYRRRLRHLGRDVVFETGVRLVGPEWMSIGDNCWIDKDVVLLAGPPGRGARRVTRRENPAFAHREGELVVGPNCHIAAHAVVSAHGGVSIGADTTIAAGARVYSLSHHHRNLSDDGDVFPYRFSSKAPPEHQALLSAPVVVGNAAAVGLNSVVLPGSTVGDRAWLGALSLLRGAVEPGTIAAGSPAGVIGRRPGEAPVRRT